jgi:ABC-2 type transport system permease protein
VSPTEERSVRPTPLRRLIVAELLRIWTIPLLSIFAVAALALAVLGIAAGISIAEGARIPLASDAGQRHLFGPTGTAWIFVLTLGILGVAGEHRHHTASATFLAEPRRWRVFVAKVGAYGLVGLLFGLVTEVDAAGIAWLWVTVKGIHLVPTSEAWLVLGGALIATVLYGILGVGIGGLLRSQVAALAAVLGWIFIVEPLFGSLWPEAQKYLPGGAASALKRAPGEGWLSMGMGGM